MRYRFFAWTTLTLACLGCVTGRSQSGAFNEDWQRELHRYTPNKPAPEGIVLGEEKGPLRTRLYLDEKGKPRMELGGGAKMSVDLRVDDDVKAGVSYKVPLSKRRQTLPPLPKRSTQGGDASDGGPE